MINQLKDSGRKVSRSAFQLDPDFTKGFTQAVQNGQIRLALEYLVQIVRDQALEIAELKRLIEEPETVLPEVEKVAVPLKEEPTTHTARGRKKTAE